MEKLVKIIENSLLEINNSIGDKITSLFYLESIKFELITKISNLENSIIEDSIEDLDKSNNFTKNYPLEKKELKLKISYFENSVSKIKTKATNDQLSIVIIGSKNISIYDAFKKDRHIETILLNNMGIVVPVNTIFNENVGKKSLVLDLLYL